MPAAARPIVTLTTDFGTRDHYVAAMKAALLRACSGARLIDVTHEVPRHDIHFGSFTLERAIDAFPAGTVHLVVVDPGVGTERRILVAELNDQTVVCPDNGLITWAWRRVGPGRASQLTWRPEHTSETFHGRDIMAPAAGMLACGTPLTDLARPIADPMLLDIAPAPQHSRTATIIHVDGFGNATTNMDHQSLATLQAPRFVVNGKDLGGLHRTYGDVEMGKPLALIGSSGLLEIAVRDGSAARVLGLRVGDQVLLQ